VRNGAGDAAADDRDIGLVMAAKDGACKGLAVAEEARGWLRAAA
jgi:hypothetical protein